MVRVVQLQDILQSILSRCGLQRPDGRPLYAYRTTPEELQALGVALNSGYLLGASDSVHHGAAFCLFASVWFCRNHAEGLWQWEPIFRDGLSLRGGLLERASQFQWRSEATRKGFQWWGVPLVETPGAVRYLVSLACQGGLPLKTIHRHTSRLSQFLRSTLHEHECWPGRGLAEIVRQRSLDLPRSLDHEVVHQLATDLVAAVTECRRVLLREGPISAQPIDDLDRLQPNWRLQIPLELDDEQAERLLRGLLTLPSSQVSESVAAVLITELSPAERGFRLLRRLELPSELSESALAGLLDLPAVRLPMRLLLVLRTAATQVAVAHATRIAGSDLYRISSLRGRLEGVFAALEARLIAMNGPHPLSDTGVEVGEVLEDVPWVFDAAEPHRMLGVGAIRSSRRELLVAVPSDSDWQAEEAGSVLQTEANVCGRTLLRVAGELRIRCQDAVFWIRAGQSAESGARYALAGRLVSTGAVSEVAFRGRPSIMECLPDGSRTEVPAAALRYRVRGPQTAWQSWSGLVHGQVTIRVERDGETLFQKRALILPEDTELKLRCTAANSGEVVLKSSGLQRVDVAGEQRGVSVVQEGSQFRVRVQHAAAERPSVLQLLLSFRDVELPLLVGCPTAAADVIDLLGNALPVNMGIPVDRVASLRLRVVSASPRVPQLMRESDNLELLKFRPLGDSGSSVFELPMALIEQRMRVLLAQDSSIDGRVDLVVRQGASPQPLLRLRIVRYAAQLDVTSETCPQSGQALRVLTVPEAAVRLLNLQPDELTLELVQLAAPERVCSDDAVVRRGPFCWGVLTDQLPQDIYLATVFVRTDYCLRPTRVSVRGRATGDIRPAQHLVKSAEELTFDEIVGMSAEAERKQAWAVYISGLARRPLDEGWQRLTAMLHACQVRPMNTFEAVLALAAEGDAMAMTALQLGGKGWLWERMQTLPFLWCLVSVKAWLRAALRFHRALREVDGLGDSEDVNKVFCIAVDNILSETSGRPPGLRAVTAIVQFSLQDFGLPPLPHQRLTELIPLSRSRHLSLIQSERSRLLQAGTVMQEATARQIPAAGSAAERLAAEQMRQCGWALADEYDERQLALLNAPLLAAWHTMTDTPVPVAVRVWLQDVRGVGTEWFDVCFEAAGYLLAGSRLRDPGFFQLKDEF